VTVGHVAGGRREREERNPAGDRERRERLARADDLASWCVPTKRRKTTVIPSSGCTSVSGAFVSA
jgi:hypothetical protein